MPRSATNLNSGAQSDDSGTYRPRTPLGQRLWAIRQRILAAGERRLDWDELERELAERRGGLEARR